MILMSAKSLVCDEPVWLIFFPVGWQTVQWYGQTVQWYGQTVQWYGRTRKIKRCF